MKTILIITGSPRAGGNSDKLADSFAKGAEEAGYRIVKFPVAFKKLSGCTACDTCWNTERACTIDDDFTELSGLLEQADKIVFAFPLYWGQAPSQLKAAIDRLYAYVSLKKKRSIDEKEYALLITGECEGLSIFDDTLHVFSDTAGYFNWKHIGNVLVSGIFKKDAVLLTDAPDRAYKFGQSLLR
jgi:multimeric flavodoxin WrbA